MIRTDVFKVHEVLHQSARSTVLRATQRADGRPVVLKFPAAQYPTPSELRRLRFEYEVGRALGERAGLRYYALESTGGSLAIVMEDFGATSLDRLLGGAPRSIPGFLALARRITALLAELHETGYAHADVKPGNVLVGPDDRVALCDFGNALPVDGAARFTSLFGTLAYVAPEQTGRTDRVVDHRADLYSLGATLYHVLTGARPFAYDDPLELLHAHLARVAAPASALRPDVPPVLDDVLARLLAKDPMDRYQSAAGLLADLARCEAAWAATGALERFTPGAQDRPTTLTLSDRVVGREEHIAALRAVFARARAGSAQFAFVRGPSGIGKTSVVRELTPEILARRAHLGSGKFEELRRHVPYSAVFDAVRAILREVLSERADVVAAWRARILDAVGPNGRLLTDALPELVQIVGEQPPVAEVSALEAQVRFSRVAEGFVAALAPPDAPLVLFLDDLQWADDASLRLMESLASVAAASAVVLGAYRDNEVTAGHPLRATLAAIERARAVTYVDVGPLDLAATRALVEQTLRRDDPAVAQLAALLHAQTHGNPFFLRQLVGVLHREGRVRFDALEGRWTWDERAIAARGFTENVVDLMVREIRAFAPDEQRALALASLIGARFDTGLLATLLGASADATDARLAAALHRRFIVPDDESGAAFRFAHDRIQEAAGELVAEAERAPLRLALGRFMLAAGAADARLFDVARHLNAARALITDRAERAGLVDVNLRAARVARASSAWSAARHHAEVALELLGEHGARDEHARWLEARSVQAETSYIAGDDAGTERAVDDLLAHARSELDRAAAYRLRLLMYLARHRVGDAIRLAKQVLGLLGVRLPARAKTHHVLAALAKTKWRMRGRTAATLTALPRMTDPTALAAMQVLAAVQTATFLAEPELFPLIVFETVRLTLAHGTAEGSAEAFAFYGMVLMAGLQDVSETKRLVSIASAVLAQTGALHRRQRVLLAEGVFVAPWTRPLRDSVEILNESHRLGMDAGDIEYASLARSVACFQAMLAGAPLEEMDATLVEQLATSRRTHQSYNIGDLARQQQYVRNLRGLAADPARMVSADYDEASDLRALQAAGDPNSISALAWYQGMLALYLRHLDRAAERAEVTIAHIASHQGTMFWPVMWFLDALASLQRGVPGRSRKALALLRKLARGAPTTFGHLADLVEAERARVEARHDRAALLYDRAIAGAQSAGVAADAALAAECAGRAWDARGAGAIARSYLAQARHLYRTWGADAKVAQLDREFELALATQRVEPAGNADLTATSDPQTERLDLDAALRASHAIASQRTLRGVVERVLASLIGDAGAERAALVLADARGQLQVVAESTAERGFVAVDAPLEGYDALPERLVRFVHRAERPVVLRDAARSGDYGLDPYVTRTGVRSLVCAPITLQGRLVGVVYLENNLAAGAFAPGRLDLVTMLAAQAAISIANAELYETLEQRVRERTDQLEVRNRFIRQTFGRYLSNEIVDSLLETPEGLALGGEKRVVTILLADLRGFSGMAERLAPEQVVALINNFLSEMTEVILRYQGTIDEFIGDAILTIFGAPLARPDDAERAVACALAMQSAMERVNAWNRAHALPQVEMGVGVNTGEVVVGNIGSQKRAKYGVVGSNVNLAGRIESYTVGGQVLIAPETRRAVRSPLRIDAELTVQPKGVPGVLTLYDVGAIEGPYAVALARGEPGLMPLALAPRVLCWELLGKDVVGEARDGALLALSEQGAVLELERAPPPLTDLRIRFTDAVTDTDTDVNAPAVDLYAKVLPASDNAEGHCVVRFTSVPDAGRAHLAALRAGRV